MLYLYQPPVRGRFVLYILVPAYCTVRESFVRICTSFRWERDLNCTYWYQLTVRERLFKFVPAYGKREICTYWYQLLVRERERFVLYILVPAYCEGEIYRYLQRLLVRKDFCCTYLYQLTERERFVQICTNLYRPLIEIEIVHICTSLL